MTANEKQNKSTDDCFSGTMNPNQTRAFFALQAAKNGNVNQKMCMLFGEISRNVNNYTLNLVHPFTDTSVDYPTCVDFEHNLPNYDSTIYIPSQNITYSINQSAWIKAERINNPKITASNNNSQQQPVSPPAQTAVNPNPLTPVTNTYIPPQTNEPVAPIIGAPSANTMNGGGFFSCPPTLSC